MRGTRLRLLGGVRFAAAGGPPTARGGRPCPGRRGLAFDSRWAVASLPLGVTSLLGSALIILWPGGVAGQDASMGVPEVLSFEAAVEVALEHSPAYLRQRNAVSVAEYGQRQSLGALFPSLNASLGFTGYTSRNKTAFDDLGRPLEEPDFVESTTSSASQNVGGSVQLFSLQNIRSYGAAGAQRELAEARTWLQAAQLRTQVGVEYFDVVQREQLVEVEERTLETAHQQLAAIRELLRVAARQPTDVLGAELDVARAEQGLQQAIGAARKAHLSLRQQMGVPMDLPFAVVGEFRPIFDPGGLDTEGLIASALRQSPRMVEQGAAVEVAERNLAAAQATRYPTLSGSYGYGRGTSARDYEALGQLALPNSGWSFGMSVNLPLFNRFHASAGIGRAAMEAENARETAREARLSLEQEVRSALIDLENAYASVRLAERAADIARERLRQGQEQYRRGTLGYTALQQMIEAVAQQERSVAGAHYAFSVSLLSVEEKVGGPIEAAG